MCCKTFESILDRYEKLHAFNNTKRVSYFSIKLASTLNFSFDIHVLGIILYATIDKLHGGMVGLCSSIVNQKNLQMSLVNPLLTYQIAIHPSIPSVLYFFISLPNLEDFTHIRRTQA